MLEILAIYYMCKKLGVMLRAKGRNPLALQILLPIGWFLGEFLGFIIGLIVTAVQNGGEDKGFNFMAYLGALAGAGLCAGGVFLIAMIIPARQDPVGFPVAGGTMPPPAPRNNPYQNLSR